MSARILIYDSSPQGGRALAEDIRASIGYLMGAVEYSVHSPGEDFRPVPEGAAAAFFALSGPGDAEAARRFRALHGEIPLVVVGDGGEQGVLSWELDACHCLSRPIRGESVVRALKKCIQIRVQNCTQS